MGMVKAIFALVLSLLGTMFIAYGLWAMFAAMIPGGPLGFIIVGFIVVIVAGALGAKTVLKR